MNHRRSTDVGQEMYGWLKDLFPIARSITGPGVRESLAYLRRLIPDLVVHDVSSGTQVFDWTVPDEWTIRDAYIADEAGNRVVDFRKNNLHVVGYSEPVNAWMDLEDLEENLYSLPDQPDAIPYVTSYYARNWGFCLTHNQRKALSSGRYHVIIDSDLKPGILNYGELIIPGETREEVFLSTYICHPSMANNELSGPVVTAALARWLQEISSRRYTYRIIFIPETIGSIAYLSYNLAHLQKNVVAGFNITCVGDDRCFSFLPSRMGNTISDDVARHVLHHMDKSFRSYTWLDRGSDERQYCAPGVDLPIATIMRSKYGEYPEYHTSLDNLELVTPKGLEGGYTALRHSIETLEQNAIPRTKVLCEPQLGKRGLYPSISQKGSADHVKAMMDLISYADGSCSLLEIAIRINKPFWELIPLVNELVKNNVLETSFVAGEEL